MEPEVESDAIEILLDGWMLQNTEDPWDIGDKRVEKQKPWFFWAAFMDLVEQLHVGGEL